MRILGLKAIVLAAGLALAGMGTATAQEAPQPAATPAATTSAASAPDASATPTPADPTLTADGQEKVTAFAHLGRPTDGALGLQDQVTPTGLEAHNFHNHLLLPIIIAICVFVLLLLIWVMFRYRQAANPTPSKTSHNTLIEVIWTVVPVLILVFIAIPSIKLLAHQYKPAPDNAVTLKAIGNQWFWSYEYPDNGDVSFTANMLKEKDQVQPGQRFRTDADGPRLLATDNRVVLPVGVPIRLVTTATDVIHSWAVPAFWIKLDAIPGRLNETQFTIEKPGVYFGQCSELCGARHGFMPIAVEAVPPAEFAAWVRSKGGSMPNDPNAPSDAAPAQRGAPGNDDTSTNAQEKGIVPTGDAVVNGASAAPITEQSATGSLED
ncbi:cytochrome c oxidase subunit II [Stakelama marina]|uniref:Cytochrome c oxidase subunit 2 n=1 Tax=Stakelama marina TaxID=2826939 RepID=A0A8T4IBT6_9SPHN|nr:cytochrome c oxidase subunit II [Stakelama marina]MBR0552488.1 cytochrome c oxidase subunit II [Stakelama marina]